MATNFALAPPAKVVDGLTAAPIDIQRITASLVFDGATRSGSGDATLEFVTGPQAGSPIFDLRQTITGAWLDGAPVPVAQVAHHDFGGGADAALRVLAATLLAGTTHTLRVTYSLGAPQASSAGSYQPRMDWSPGPRLAFNFGFTDLGGGRYLEAWIPANLIFDQFELALTLRILNSAVAHTLITNGTVASLGANHWSVAFPARFTALSPLLELRASDTVTGTSGTVTLPVSGTTVTIEAWKLAAGPANLATQVNNLRIWLADNESNVGPYVHGNRFVAFFNVGGMEYEGGTTTGMGALRHETFHSWWARGVKPASQPDAWWDEAWTVFNVDTPPVATPFDFSAPPVELAPRNPWIRATVGGSYTFGDRLFEGFAALSGVANLETWMREFYAQRRGTLVTSEALEQFLLCRSGNPLVVDGFHRFVYGFPDPSPAPDLWIRDDPAHAGGDLWAGAFWNSPDLWVRNKDDGGTTHQAPEFGQDNWFYARVRNRGGGAARHFAVAFNVKGFAGTEFTYPGDFLPCIAAATGFDLAPGATTVVKARWPRQHVPPAGTHACWLAAVLMRSEQPVAGRHVWEDNSLAQKNVTIVDLKPNEWIMLPFVVSNLHVVASTRYLLELRRPGASLNVDAVLLHPTGRPFGDAGATMTFRTPPAGDAVALLHDHVALDCGARHARAADATPLGRDDAGAVLSSRSPRNPRLVPFDAGAEIPFAPGEMSRVELLLRPREQIVPALRLHVPATARAGDVLRVDLVQCDPKRQIVLGGVTVELRVR
jgi:hypothetical protein